MVYGMQYRTAGLLFATLCLVLAAGCTAPAQAPSEDIPVTGTTALPAPDSPTIRKDIAEIALQPEDIPADYTLKDRSVMIAPEVTQLSRDLGWLKGYFVSFDRTGRLRSDFTRIRQSVSVFPVESMKKVFTLEKIAIEGGETMRPSPYEIPFPTTGDRSIAYRMTDSPEPGQVTYTVIFTKKNVYERITMSGTTTDYETLKEIVRKAAERIG